MTARNLSARAQAWKAKWILKTSVRQRTELMIGWASPILLTCVDQRYFNTFACQTKGEDAFEAWLQNALTFLAERGVVVGFDSMVEIL